MPQNTALYFPASQDTQEVAPLDAANFPAAQAVHDEEAATDDFPATQSAQMVKPVADAYFPSAQLVQELAEEPEYVPSAQDAHDVYSMLYKREYFPELQAAQEVAEAAEYKPAPQAVQPDTSFPPATLSIFPASQTVQVEAAAEL